MNVLHEYVWGNKPFLKKSVLQIRPVSLWITYLLWLNCQETQGRVLKFCNIWEYGLCLTDGL